MSPTPEERAGTVRFNMPGKTDREIVALIAEAIRQAEAAAREEEREACAKIADRLGQTHSARKIRARKSPAAETAGAGGGDRRGCDDQV